MKKITFQPGREFALQLDAEDELASYRDAFVIAEPDVIYLDGNSLGRLPKRTVERMQTVISQEWGQKLILGWREAGWLDAPKRLGDKIGRLLGAVPGQIVAIDSTSVNLFKCTMAALILRPDRTRIVSDVFNFPTDVYVFQGCMRLFGNRHTLHLVPSSDGITIDQQMVFDAIDERIALVSFSHPAFKSCFAYDVEAITRRAHEAGALVLWDLSHAVGAVPVELDLWGVDFAAGCSYKYLNGGPGAPAWLYVRKGLHDKVLSPIWGWFTHRAPFLFDLEYDPAEGISRFLCGTPPMLSMSALEPSLDLLLEAGLPRLRAKSVRQTSYVVYLIDKVLAPLGFWVGSPRDPARRGAHVLVCHSAAYRINCALVEELSAVADFRPPNGIRLGLSPLYTSFEEIWEAVDRLRRVVVEERYVKYPVYSQPAN